MEQLTISGNTITSIENFTPALLQKENTYLEIITCSPDPSEEELKIYLEEEWRKEDEKRAVWAAAEAAAKKEYEWFNIILDRASAEAKALDAALQKTKEVDKLNQSTEPLILVEFFESVKRTNDNHHPVHLNTLLKRATESTELKTKTEKFRTWLNENPDLTKKQKSEEKVKTFTSVTFAGTFGGTGKASEIKKLSGLVVLDFDHIIDTELRTFEEIKTELENDKYVFLSFVSPSGDGIKLVIKHDVTEASNWEKLCLAIEKYFKEKHFLKVDGSGKDISRQCFIPFIDKLYRNDNSEVWLYSDNDTFINTTNDNFSDNIITINDNINNEPKQNIINDELYKEYLYVSEFFKEKHINITESYPDWLSIGFSLASLGEKGREIYHILSSVSNKYDKTECNEQYNKCLQEFNDTKSGINKFLVTANEVLSKYVTEKSNAEIVLPDHNFYDMLPLQMKTALMKYDSHRKFIAFLALLGNISGILPNLKLKHSYTEEYEANKYLWIIAKSASGKKVINEIRLLFTEIEDKIENENEIRYAEYKDREKQALAACKAFTERQPAYQSLYIADDTNKASLIEDLHINKGRGIVSASEANTIIGADSSQFGDFMDVLNKCAGHEPIDKGTLHNKIKIMKPCLSMIWTSTPDTAYKFLSDEHQEDGTLSRFLAFFINFENELRNIYGSDIVEDSTQKQMNIQNKKHWLNLWKLCKKLDEPIYLEIDRNLNYYIYKQYKQFEQEAKYIYKFNTDIIKRMLIMHKRIILNLSAQFHYETHGNFNSNLINGKLPVYQRAIKISDILMKIYRDAFIVLMFEIEKYKLRHLSISNRTDTIKKMRFKGYADMYLAELFDLPIQMINCEHNKTDGRIKHSEELKLLCAKLCTEQPNLKADFAKGYNVTDRTIRQWIADYEQKKESN